MLRNLLSTTLLFLAALTPARLEALPPQTSARPMNLSGYLAELDRWAAASRRLKDHPEEAAELRRALPEAWSVKVEGQLYVVPAGWLGSTLAAFEKDPKSAAENSGKIQSRLDAVRAEAMSLGQPPSTPDLKTAHGKLEEILNRREFRNVQGPSWISRLRRRLGVWILEGMEKLLGPLRIPQSVTRTFGWGLAIGLVLIFLVWLVRQFLGRPFQRALDLSGAPPPTRGWRDWARQAVAAAARGQHRDAIRLAYWAGVFRLEESGVWQVERARTPREYLRLLPAGHPQRDPLATLTARFERVWYGGQAASADDFQFTITQLEALGCAFPSNPATGIS